MKFNPLTDLTLSQRDTAVRQLGGITETEIGGLSSSLRTASQRTGQIVDVLRRDNKKTNSDLNKIRDLDRRLKRVIPIIPEKFGEAGNIFPDRQPIPQGGLSLPRLPKFPKIPTLPPVGGPSPAPVTPTVPVPEREREPQREPGFEFPPITIPGLPLPGRPGLPLPDFEGIPGLAFRKGAEIVASADKKLTDFAKNMNKFLEENPGATIVMDPTMGFGSTGAKGLMAVSPFLLRNLSNLKLLSPKALVFLQQLAAYGLPLLLRGRGRGLAPSAARLSTYGRQIGPKPAPVKLPTPPPITAAKVAPKTPVVPAPAANLYEQLLKSTRFGTSSLGQVGRPLGGERVLRRAPLMKRFDSGGIFRQGTVPREVYAMRRALRDIGIDEELARISDPTNLYSRLAKDDVLRELGLVDEAFQRIVSGGKTIKKTGPVVKPREQLLGPERFLMQGPEVDTVLGALETPLARIQPGTIADFIGLSHPEVRLDFLKYIAGIKNTKSGQRNYKMIEKLLRQTGMYVKMGKDGVIPMDDDVLGFVLNFYKKKGIDPRPFLQKMKENGLLEGGIEGLKTNKAKSVRDAYQFLKEMEQNKTVLPLPENYKVPPGGPQSSFMGRPRSMDIASLGIDTSVEIQEIYYIVG